MYVGTKRSPAMVIVLSIVTCGIYSIWWHYKVGDEINNALNREAVKPIYVLLALLCFPVLYYYVYTLDNALQELAPLRGKAYSSNFLLWIITMLLGFGFIVEMIQLQSTLNDIWDAPVYYYR